MTLVLAAVAEAAVCDIAASVGLMVNVDVDVAVEGFEDGFTVTIADCGALGAMTIFVDVVAPVTVTFVAALLETAPAMLRLLVAKVADDPLRVRFPPNSSQSAWSVPLSVVQMFPTTCRDVRPLRLLSVSEPVLAVQTKLHNEITRLSPV